MGLSTNQIYKEDGHRREAHSFEDSSFHFKIDSGDSDVIFFYGVFNGTDGSSVADFAAQRMPAEILLGQLNDKTTPAEVKEVLREAFFAVERSYFESIDDLLAERANLLFELPHGINTTYDAYQQYPDVVNRLRTVNTRLSVSCSAAVALIFKGEIWRKILLYPPGFLHQLINFFVFKVICMWLMLAIAAAYSVKSTMTECCASSSYRWITI